jgi:hypothetical protein
VPTLYRRHDAPAPDRIAALREFLGSLGVKLGGVHGIEPKHLRAVIAQVADRPERALVETLVLRSLALAVYDDESRRTSGSRSPNTRTSLRRSAVIRICWCIARSGTSLRGGKSIGLHAGKKRCTRSVCTARIANEGPTKRRVKPSTGSSANTCRPSSARR